MGERLAFLPADPAFLTAAGMGGLEFLQEETGGIIANKRAEVGLHDNPDRVVVIRGTAVMGGITVKKAWY